MPLIPEVRRGPVDGEIKCPISEGHVMSSPDLPQLQRSDHMVRTWLGDCRIVQCMELFGGDLQFVPIPKRGPGRATTS